jgi:hypothetical protein
VNETEWDGSTLVVFWIGCPAPNKSTFVCKMCKAPPTCVAKCGTKVYYIFGKECMTRVCMLLGVHDHLVKDGEYQDFKEQPNTLFRE